MLPSFRGASKTRTKMCNCTSENLEIPDSMLRSLRNDYLSVFTIA